MTRTRLTARVLAAIAAVLGTLGAVSLHATPTSTSTPISISTSTSTPTLEYATSFAWEGAREASGARIFTTDLGYEVRIDAGYVGLSTVELVACEGERARIDDAPIFTVFPRSAWANHGRVHDSSLHESDVALSILSVGPRPFGDARASGNRYCSAHILFAPLDAVADDSFHLARASVYLRGTYRAPLNGETRAFVAHSTLAEGAVVFAPALADVTSAGALRVEITLHSTRAFDGIRFGELSEIALGHAFVRRLAQTSTLRVER